MALIWKKKGYFLLTFLIFYSPGKSYKNSFSIYLTHIGLHTWNFAHLIDFFALPILKKKKKNLYQVWFLFGMIPGVDSYSRRFGTINK